MLIDPHATGLFAPLVLLGLAAAASAAPGSAAGRVALRVDASRVVHTLQGAIGASWLRVHRDRSQRPPQPVASELDREVHVALRQPVLSVEPVELEAVEEGQLALDVEAVRESASEAGADTPLIVGIVFSEEHGREERVLKLPRLMELAIRAQCQAQRLRLGA